MCTPSCLEFGKNNIRREDIQDKRVLEVGALDVNGSFRPLIEPFRPKNYIGVDLELGPGVDKICKGEDLIKTFGEQTFDVLISTEMIEHARNWKTVVHNMKRVLKNGGLLIITTRSKGFSYHGYPFDYWRYEIEDMQSIFSDFNIENLEKDPVSPGVFMRARKPVIFRGCDLWEYKLYSVIKEKPVRKAYPFDILLLKDRKIMKEWVVTYLLKRFPFLESIPKPVKRFLKKMIGVS